MIECVHAYWLLLWLIGLFSRYSHRNCIINYPQCCHGGTMESPDEYLGRLNFLGSGGVRGHRGALLQWRDGSSMIVCVRACVRTRMLVCVCLWAHAYSTCFCTVHLLSCTFSSFQDWAVPIDFASVSLYCNSINVAWTDGGRRRGCVCVHAAVGDEPFTFYLVCLLLLIMHAASFSAVL